MVLWRGFIRDLMLIIENILKVCGLLLFGYIDNKIFDMNVGVKDVLFLI